jgi:hypothetical protein
MQCDINPLQSCEHKINVHDQMHKMIKCKSWPGLSLHEIYCYDCLTDLSKFDIWALQWKLSNKSNFDIYTVTI